MTLPTRTLEGWYFDQGDPTVGIFGEEWVHDACPDFTGEGEQVDDQVIARVRHDDQTVRFYHLLTCTDCAAQRIAIDYDWDPVPLEDDYEAARLDAANA